MERTHRISIHSPLQGEWKVLRPPGHHRYALDFVQWDGRTKAAHAASKLAYYVARVPSSSFFCWNKPVFAPIDGVVIQVGNGWPDNEYVNIWQAIRLWLNATFKFRPKEEGGRLDIRPNAGNYLMIQASEGYVVFLAHLKNQSVAVADGAKVRRGDVVGMVGSSGNSTMPHLHINLFDQVEDPFRAKVLPFVFTRYMTRDGNERWVDNEATIPSAGAVVRFYG